MHSLSALFVQLHRQDGIHLVSMKDNSMSRNSECSSEQLQESSLEESFLILCRGPTLLQSLCFMQLHHHDDTHHLVSVVLAQVERLQMENHQSEKSEPADSRDTKNLSNEKSSCEPNALCSVKLESDCCDREDLSSPARLQIQQQANSRSPPTIDVKSSSSARVVEVKEEVTTTSSDSNSSDILDADSPRTTDSTSSLSTSVQAEAVNPEALGQSSCPQFPPESFVSPCNLLPSICEEDMSTAGQAGVSSRPAGIVKLEEGSTGFHDDHSCNYLLPQLDEQCILPWWDWS